jgi:hypothetical protein
MNSMNKIFQEINGVRLSLVFVKLINAIHPIDNKYTI